jgi:hypothetical protein
MRPISETSAGTSSVRMITASTRIPKAQLVVLAYQAGIVRP